MEPVRIFRESDLPEAQGLAMRLRAADASVEPFADRLPALWAAAGDKRKLWRISPGAGLSLAAARDAKTLEVYGAVMPASRGRGLATALMQPALDSKLALRATVREPSPHGAAFLLHHKFKLDGRALLLAREGAPPRGAAFEIRALDPAQPADRKLFAQLSAKADKTLELEPDDYASRDLLLVGDFNDAPAAGLSGSLLGDALRIEELGVLPRARRKGLATALVAAALRRTNARVVQLQVDESNEPARGLYNSLGFVVGGARAHYLRPLKKR